MGFHVLEKYRIRTGSLASNEQYGNNGAFLIPCSGMMMVVIASDGLGWEHVSVSFRRRTPTWDEMCFVKSIFWDKEDCVIQYHPSEKEYVNNHPYCLHLWRPIDQTIPIPPKEMIGIK